MAGGAFAHDSIYRANGGAGGGTTGVSGSYIDEQTLTAQLIGTGATQTEGGAGGTSTNSYYSGETGTFGIGGNTGYKYNNSNYYSNGAGGRWLVWWRSSRKFRKKK